MRQIWEYNSTEKIIFGVGAINNLNKVLTNLKVKNILFITDPVISKLGILDNILNGINSMDLNITVYDKAVPEPPIQSVMECVEFAKNKTLPEAIIAVGGGSSIDLAKSTSLILTHGGKPQDYFGENLVPGPIIPLITIPTTAGTGSEVTSVAVLTDVDSNLKIGISDNYLRAKVAILDPELTLGLPPYVTACSGMDALSHAIESYMATPFSQIKAKGDLIFQGSMPLSDIYALKGIELIIKSLKTAVHEGSNIEARSDMMLGSLLGGLALSNTGTAAAHAAAYPIGGLVKSPHGEVTGLLLPYVIEYNSQIDQKKTRKLAEILCEDLNNVKSEDLGLVISDWILKLLEDIGLPTKLSQIGIDKNDITYIAEGSLKIDRIIRNNPRVPTKEDFSELLLKAY